MTKQEKAFLHKRKWVVTSLEASRGVYKNHRDFVDKIRSIEKQLNDEDFCQKNLIRTEHRTTKNTIYWLTKKGCKKIAEKLSAEKRLAFEQRYKELFDVPPADSAPETAPVNPKLDPPKPEAKSIELYMPQSVADFGVFEKDGKIVVSSRTVAKVFGKQHAHVLRDINGLTCSPLFNQSNFGFVEYSDTKGETRPECLMTRNGFMFLVMGYTGETAATIKEGYINIFDTMEAQLKRVATVPTIDMDDPVELAKIVHKLSGNYLKEKEAKARLLIENIDLKAEREENAPKLKIADAVIVTNDDMEVGQYQDYLNQVGINKLFLHSALVTMGRNNLIEWFLENKYVCRTDNGINENGFRRLGIAKTKELLKIHPKEIINGRFKKVHHQIYITGPGKLFFVKEIMRQLTEAHQLMTLTLEGLKLLATPDENGMPQINFSQKRRRKAKCPLTKKPSNLSSTSSSLA